MRVQLFAAAILTATAAVAAGPYAVHPPGCRVIEVSRAAGVEPDDPNAPIRQEATSRAWLVRVNAERHRAGWRDRDGRRISSPPLRFSPQLQRAAEWKLRHAARTGDMSHADTGVRVQMEGTDYAYDRYMRERAWAFGFAGQTSEGIGMGDRPTCLELDLGFPGGFDATGRKLVNHHEDGMNPGWTEFGFAAGDGLAVVLYGRADRWSQTPIEEAEEHQPTTFYGSEEQAGRTPPPPLP